MSDHKHCALDMCDKEHEGITCRPDGVQCEHYIPPPAETTFGPSTCPDCGVSYTLPKLHKCKPTYKELQEMVFAYESVKAPVNPLLAENKRLREECRTGSSKCITPHCDNIIDINYCAQCRKDWAS